MGMYDYINFECDCPQCGARVKGFQSKDGACVMATLEFYEVNNFYSNCPKCGLWLEFDLLKRENREIRVEDFRVSIKNSFMNITQAKEHFKNPRIFHKKQQDKMWGSLGLK